jgi:hypothetical protein
MTLWNKPKPSRGNAAASHGAACKRCRYDLYSAPNGFVYCSNGRCQYSRTPHETSWRLNL